jgi:S1-C subfamily serine protease
LTASRADRPYGRFPRKGRRPEEAPPVPVAGPRGLRAIGPWLAARTRRERASLAATAVLVLAAVAIFVSALPQDYRAPQVLTPPPTPTPTVPQLYADVSRSVVTIETRTADGHSSLGTGVVMDDFGDILTALHVVQGASDIVVTFADGTSSPAKILVTQPENDIAAVRALRPPDQLVVATLGNPNALHIGDDAIVVGNPFGLTRSLSTGVISGLNRSVHPQGAAQPLQGLIQFDASVNPGNSGGPLFNRDGEVVGIVTGLANPNGQPSFSGVGFAVTIDAAAAAVGLPPD